MITRRIGAAARQVWRLYYDGFREMTVGRTLWVIILVKLFVMFAVMKLLFFPDFLANKAGDDESRADYVRKELTGRGAHEGIRN